MFFKACTVKPICLINSKKKPNGRFMCLEELKIRFLFLLAFLMPVNGICSFEPLECPNSNLIRIYVDTEIATPCKELSEINTVFTSIRKFSGFTSPVTLFLDRPSYMAQASISGLMLLSQRQKGWREVRNLEKSKLIWAHEFGHIVFNEIIINQFPAISDFHRYMVAHDEISIQSLNPTSDNFQQVKFLWTQEAGLARDILKPYTELFADLVAVLYANDGSAMKRAMTLNGMSEIEKYNARLYDFYAKIALDDYTGNDVHLVFGPARSYIGSHLLKFPMSLQQKQNVLSIVASSMLEEMNQLWTTRTKPTDFRSLNLSFIDRLRRRIANSN